MRHLTFNGNAGEMGCLPQGLSLSWTGSARLAVIHSKGTEHVARMRKNGSRPARAQSVRFSHVSILLPQRIVQNVGDDNRLFAVHSGAARSRLRSDTKPVDGSNVRFGQAWSGAVPHMLSVVVQEKNRTKHASELGFHNPHEASKDFLQRSVSGYHLQNTALSVPQGLRSLAVGYVHQSA